MGNVADMVTAGPEARGPQVEQEAVNDSGEVGALIHQIRDLTSNAGRPVPVVVVPLQNDVSAGELAGKVALGADRRPLSWTDVLDGGAGGKLALDGVRAVVDDHQLAVRIVLGQEVADRADD